MLFFRRSNGEIRVWGLRRLYSVIGEPVEVCDGITNPWRGGVCQGVSNHPKSKRVALRLWLDPCDFSCFALLLAAVCEATEKERKEMSDGCCPRIRKSSVSI
jgi:hypothetical protein